MSSKSTIIFTKDNHHIYEDCNHPRHNGEAFLGNDIFFEVWNDFLLDAILEKGKLTIRLYPCDIQNVFGELIEFNQDDIASIQYAPDGLTIQIIGGSNTAKEIWAKRK